jgi:glycine hydroxymethyltransferase
MKWLMRLNNAIDRLKSIQLRLRHVQPQRCQANAARAGNITTAIKLGLDQSGRHHHGSPVNFSGKIYKPSFYGEKKKPD